MGEECDLRQLMLATEADEEDSPDREEQPPPPPPPPAMPPKKVRKKFLLVNYFFGIEDSFLNQEELPCSQPTRTQTTPTTKVIYVNEKTEPRERSVENRPGSMRSSVRQHKPRKGELMLALGS